MKTYIVVFNSDLSEKESYAAEESIKRFGRWARLFQGAWLIKTDAESDEIYNRIIYPSDKRLVVMRIHNEDYYGYHSKEIWDWIKDN